MKRKNTIFTMLALVVFVTAVGAGYVAKAQGSVAYGKAYTIGNILSDYQYFVQGDLTATSAGHCVGAVAVGGTLDTQNSIGDGQIAASYVKNIKKLSDFSQGSWITNSYRVKDLYYDTVDAGIPSWLSSRFTYNPDYISFNSAFSSLKTESDLYASQGTAAYSVSYGTLTINLDSTKDTYVTIPYSVAASASGIVLAGLSSVQDFVNHRYVISFSGVNTSNYTFSFYNIQFNGQSFSQKLKDLSNGSNGSQINLDGMKLIWNFPDATGTVLAQGLSGHLVAPQADVSVTGGNFEGGIIAKNVTKADAEGHYYTFYKAGTAPEVVTTAPTVAPTVAPTAAPTVALTTAPTVAPTTAPTTAPTIAPTVAPTVAPTTAPTIAPTVAPTVAPTTAPTVAPTTAPTVAPTVAPTTAPTTAPTVAPTVAPTTAPTVAPTVAPTTAPTAAPTTAPTTAPTVDPVTVAPATVVSEGNVLNASKTIIAVVIKDENTNEKVSNLEVLAKNQTTGQEYKAKTDSEGTVIIEVNEGSYNISVSNSNFSYGNGKTLYITSGGYENVKFNVSMSNEAETTPKTGENSWIFLYSVIAAFSGVIVIVASKRRKIEG